MDLTPVDKDYEARMLAFEVDCFDGKGEPIACHRVGEYYSVVANDHVKAAKVYQDNCTNKNYSPSCFNLGRLFCKLSCSLLLEWLLLILLLLRNHLIFRI